MLVRRLEWWTQHYDKFTRHSVIKGRRLEFKSFSLRLRLERERRAPLSRRNCDLKQSIQSAFSGNHSTTLLPKPIVSPLPRQLRLSHHFSSFKRHVSNKENSPRLWHRIYDPHSRFIRHWTPSILKWKICCGEGGRMTVEGRELVMVDSSHLSLARKRLSVTFSWASELFIRIKNDFATPTKFRFRWSSTDV